MYLSKLAICRLAPFCHVKSADGDFTEEKRKISIYNDTQLELHTDMNNFHIYAMQTHAIF